MGGSAHHSDVFEEEAAQMEEDDAGRCREHEPIRSGFSDYSHDRPPSTSISQSTNPAQGGGYPSQPPGNQEHKAVTVGQVVKAISQLGERKGATMNQIRNALSKESRDMERPPACCVKRALVRGIQAGHLERSGGTAGAVSRFLLPTGKRSRQIQYRLPRKDSSGRSRSASKAQKRNQRKKSTCGQPCSKGKGKGKGKGKRKAKGKGKGKSKSKGKGKGKGKRKRKTKKGAWGWSKAKAKRGKNKRRKSQKTLDSRSSSQKVKERKSSRKCRPTPVEAT